MRLGAWPSRAAAMLVLAAIVVGCAQRSRVDDRDAGANASTDPEAGSAARDDGGEGAGEAARAPEEGQPVTPPATDPATLKDPAMPEPSPAGLTWIEVFPQVRVDCEAGVVEFDAEVVWEFHNPDEPDTWLEQTVCIPDTREHESLVMTRAKASHLHAALLLAGLTPGKPGGWTQEEDIQTAFNPEGDRVVVELLWVDAAGIERVDLATDWVEHVPTGRVLSDVIAENGQGYVFAGSRMVEREGRTWYDADMTGEVIGLMTFSGDLIAWSVPLSPEVRLQAPIF